MNLWQQDEDKDMFRNLSRTEKEEQFLETLTSYFSSNPFLISDSGAQKIESELEKLNKNLEDSSLSSTKLAEALNKLTRYGVLAAWGAVFVSFGHLVFEIFNYFCN